MSHLTADESMLEQLQGILAPVEIRDPSGKVFGVFTPVDYLRIERLFDLKEADRVATTERVGCSTEDVKRYLRSLEPR